MNRRLRGLVRAGAAAGLIASLIGGRAFAQEPAEPLPDAAMIGETVELLEAARVGELEVAARGAGSEAVTVQIRNTSGRRLHVVIPPGLVAAAGSGQFQSMGLGLPSNRPDAFGRFESPGNPGTGFRSIAPTTTPTDAVTVPAGQEVTLKVPGVCLNLGLPDPTARDRFRLMDVADYSPDPRVQRALRSLGTLGTDRRVAQVVMWHVCNGYSLAQIAKVTPKTANRWELALADRFIEALDASTAPGLVDPAYLTEGRVFVRVQGEGALAADADRLNEALDGLYLLGLPSRSVRGQEVPTASGPALYLIVTLGSSNDGLTAGRVAVHGMARDGEWVNGGTAKLAIEADAVALDGPAFASELDRAIARQFVSVRKVKTGEAGTVLRVENGLPLTIAGLVLDASKDGDGTATVPVDAIGLGPLRHAFTTVQAEGATAARVVLNGL